MAFGGCDEDGGAAAVVPRRKRLKKVDGDAVVSVGTCRGLRRITGRETRGRGRLGPGPGPLDVHQIKELDDQAFVGEFLDAAGLTADMRAASFGG